jgi:hypothetical protein
MMGRRFLHPTPEPAKAMYAHLTGDCEPSGHGLERHTARSDHIGAPRQLVRARRAQQRLLSRCRLSGRREELGRPH